MTVNNEGLQFQDEELEIHLQFRFFLDFRTEISSLDFLPPDVVRCQFNQHFYVRIFRTNVVSAAFSSYVLALAKNSYRKRARKTLMKLTVGVNFFNI